MTNGNTFASKIKDSQRKLNNLLIKEGIDRSLIEKIIESGYSCIEATLYFGEPEPCLFDSFYGSKWGIGLIPLKQFLTYIKNDDEKYPKYSHPTYRIRSLDDAINILKSNRYKKFFSNGRMCFRGQTQEYNIKRTFPNPFMSDESGYEPLLIPSFWRPYLKDLNQRPAESPPSIFSTIFADGLIYQGLDVGDLVERNIKRYGVHTMSDLGDFPDPESHEYHKRYLLHKIYGSHDVQLPLLEQHYGMQTIGLDVTFDIGTALFFATNKFVMTDRNKTTYLPVDGHEHHGIVYCMVYEDPPLTKTSDMITALHVFEHVPPVRPLRQKCALPFFHSMNFNEAATEIVAVLIIDGQFEMSGLPDAKYLFPDADEDPFYQALLRQKAKCPKIYKNIIEYDI